MIRVRRASERGQLDLGWLRARYTFSFAGYVDRRHMGFRGLRVLNEDVVAPGRGFDEHPHDNMEIITCVLEGALTHRDSLGNTSTLRPGEFQRMTAGTGILHSEFNPSPTESLHLLQIWIRPRTHGLPPGYEQRAFPPDDERGRFRLIASPDARDGSLRVDPDVRLWSTRLSPGVELELDLEPGRGAWVQVAAGSVELSGERLDAGDGAAAEDEASLRLRGLTESRVLVFDLA